MQESKRQRYEKLRGQLEIERASFIPHYRELSEHILPRRARFFTSDTNRGERRNQKIIDSTATMAARTLRSGMMAGVTSPARDWKRLTTPDPSLAEFGQTKHWLHYVNQRMSTIFLRSNLYNILPQCYGDIGVFATAPVFIEENMDNVIHATSFPVGSYMIAKNHLGKVNVFFRDFRMTVRQLVDQFGVKDSSGMPDWSVFSRTVRAQYERGEYEAWVEVCHVIQPNQEYKPSSPMAKNKRFVSCYYEKGSAEPGEGDKMLRESGYDYFPVLCPRWEVTGEDVYGTSCPGMEALGDIKALQIMQKRKAQAIEKMVNPPMKAPTSLQNKKTSILPGDITYFDETSDAGGFRPVHEVNIRVGELTQDIREHQMRIQMVFFEDMFKMLANMERRDITAREIEERHEEKLLVLGPVLEQLNQDLLDPLIEITFNIMQKQRLVPPPPDSLQGEDLKVEYISMMAQAQKLVGISGLERHAQFVLQLAGAVPSVLDKTDFDQMVDDHAESVGVSPKVTRSDDEVQAIRDQQSQMQAQQQQLEMIPPAAKAAKDLSETALDTDNALAQMLAQAEAGQMVEGA